MPAARNAPIRTAHPRLLATPPVPLPRRHGPAYATLLRQALADLADRLSARQHMPAQGTPLPIRARQPHPVAPRGLRE